MSEAAIDYYELLDVPPDATPDRIESVSRALLTQLSPLDVSAGGVFRAVEAARDVLTDPHRRERYDAKTYAISEDQDRKYRLYRDQIASEANWVGTRTTWLLTGNAFLATAMAIASVANVRREWPMWPVVDAIRAGLPTLGVVVNVGAILMLIAAEWVTLMRAHEYRRRESAELPSLIGAVVPHVIGIATPLLFAAFFLAGWIRISGKLP